MTLEKKLEVSFALWVAQTFTLLRDMALLNDEAITFALLAEVLMRKTTCPFFPSKKKKKKGRLSLKAANR